MTTVGREGQENQAPPDDSAFFFRGDGKVQVTRSSHIAPGVHSFEDVARAHGWLTTRMEPERPTLRSRLSAIARRVLRW